MRGVIGVIIMTMLTGNTAGCGAIGPEARMEEAQEALGAKYGGEFVVTEYLGQESFEKYYTVTAYAAEHPELLFEASVNTEGENAGKYVSDTYVSRRVCAKLAEAVSVNLSGLKGIYAVYAEELNPYARGTDPEISVQDYLAGETGVSFTIYLNYVPGETTPEEVGREVAHFSEGTGIDRGKLALFIMDENTLGEAGEYRETHAVLSDGYQQIVDASYAGTVTFRDGNVDSSEVEGLLKGRF